MEQSAEQVEEALERAGKRLAEALDRIASAADRRHSASRQAGEGEVLEEKIRELEADNRKLREAGRAVADGIDETIETLRRARA